MRAKTSFLLIVLCLFVGLMVSKVSAIQLGDTLQINKSLSSIKTELEYKDPDSLSKRLAEAFQSSKNIKYPKGQAKVLLYQGILAYRKGEDDLAVKKLNESIDIASDSELTEIKGQALMHLSKVQLKLFQFNLASDNIMRAIEIFETYEYQSHLIEAYQSISNLYTTIGKQKVAIKYDLKALELAKINGDTIELINGLFNIYVDYTKLGNHKMAVHYLNEIQATLPNGHPYIDSTLLSSKIKSAYASYNLGEKDFQKALELNLDAIERYADFQNAPYYFCLLLIRQAKIQLGLENYKEAKINLDKALEIAQKENFLELQRDVFSVYAEYYKMNNKYQQAYEMHRKLFALHDSLLQSNHSKYLANLTQIHNTESKDQKIFSQKLIIENQKKQNWILIGVGSFVVLILTSLLIWVNQKNKLKESQDKALEVAQKYQYASDLVENQQMTHIKISEDLHEEVNGALAALRFRLSSFEGVDAESIALLDSAINKLRSTSYGIAPLSLKNFNLSEALRDFSINFETETGISIAYEYTKFVEVNLSFMRQVLFYKCYEEWMHYSVEEIGSTQLKVSLNVEEKLIHLKIQDPLNEIHKEVFSNPTVKNIVSRLNYLGATQTLKNNAQGYYIQISIPNVFTEEVI